MTRAAENLISLHNNQRPVEFRSKPLMRRPRQISYKDTYLSKTDKHEYYPTDTTLAEELIWDIMTGLSGGQKTYNPDELKQIFESGYHPAFFGSNERPNNNILTAKATYVLPRLVATEHIPLLADAEIHFTDNAKEFYQEINNERVETFIPDKRARVYRVDEDENGRAHITYLLRHSHVDNYIDAFELVSFLAFTEYFKSNILESSFNSIGAEGKQLEKDLSTLGFDKDNIFLWASKRNQGRDNGLFLSPSFDFTLKPPWVTYTPFDSNRPGELSEHESDVIGDAVWMIKKSLEKSNRSIPNHVIMGNDFSIPLMATLGLFNDHDIETVFNLASPNKAKPERQTLKKEEIEKEVMKITDEGDKEIIRKFRVYQYLNLYNGNNPGLLDMKRLLDSIIDNMRIRILSAGATGLGSPVDLIDFSQLPRELIAKIKHPKIRELMFNLHEKKARLLSLSYPLGENIYPLVKLFNKELGINNIGFFGKVGSVVDEQGIGVRRGRVVIPEFFTRVGEFGKTALRRFRNILDKKEDTILIPTADEIESIIGTNSVLLQTAQDIQTYREIIKQSKQTPRILLDSESYYLQQACEDLSIDPAIIYYISDNTKIDGSLDEDMTKKMGAEGTLASLESPLIILNKWLKQSTPLEPKFSD